MKRTALIVGAGIGGLSAAIALRQAGWNVRLFERAATARELAARGESPTAFDWRCIPRAGVAPRSQMPQFAPSSRLATRAPRQSRCNARFHHGLLGARGETARGAERHRSAPPAGRRGCRSGTRLCPDAGRTAPHGRNGSEARRVAGGRGARRSDGRGVAPGAARRVARSHRPGRNHVREQSHRIHGRRRPGCGPYPIRRQGRRRPADRGGRRRFRHSPRAPSLGATAAVVRDHCGAGGVQRRASTSATSSRSCGISSTRAILPNLDALTSHLWASMMHGESCGRH